MKKLLPLLMLCALVGPIKPAFANTPADSGQILTSLLQHVTAVSEFTTHGQVKVQFLDGIVQFGHYKNDYVAAIDGGVSNSLAVGGNGKLAATWGFHVHLFSLVNNYFNINPALAQTLQLLEVTPRYSYDADVHQGVLGFTFGARIPF